MMEKISKSEKETEALGERFMSEAIKTADKKGALIFCLEGELGAGKTRLIKGMGRALGLGSIQSPTFTLMRKFKISKQDLMRGEVSVRELFFHVDCYRIEGPKDLEQIGLDKILRDPVAIVALEWADKIKDSVPKPYWDIRMEHYREGERKINIQLHD
ncbi:MAG: tRNA (adenosine(37)-N6)-threonylcarbamoyltransferase complex ATPase subunit type 1 TsaE [Candidatus Magasanikbacteria bacterium RIFCSPHIGHO2_01_FULL_47_8]|uniref:tRNA threonylcarbamoyladenosine biosynthesis protein TsaE n=1 Tax=Candidatus Magasanikbacteria bacterium RIFCSPHIGHO2_01_FULL_47_8 TaxID=1798673 RepID=A0A1F6MCX2_9BACT|nr:MAG: tRNA (adenosine(37)-N6)-threonylcarbamoyltransferase complex ATPase subunit type 1 TsaE [Candidatus Magasanikbacteria bacterium RIFCSPHIGHO2_01_FULL_47_8]